jgi:hypothetical protein
MIAQATTRPQINAETLTTMRLPELWEVFAQVTGESSRCPNRNFLVRRILEANHHNLPLSVPRPAIALADDAANDTDLAEVESADGLADEEGADDLADEEGADDFIGVDDQAQPFLDEDDAAFAHAVNESDEDPDAGVADDADEEAEDNGADEVAEDETDVEEAEPSEVDDDEEIDPEAFADEEEDPNALHVANEQIRIPDSDKPAPNDQAAEANTPEAKRKSLRGAPIEVLQARYLEVVGKPTASSHRTYLLWKIKQVERGLIVPRLRPATSPIDDEKFQVLPIRLPISTVEQMDAACERLGLANRMVLFRRALRAFFFASHEPQVARLFDPTL